MTLILSHGLATDHIFVVAEGSKASILDRGWYGTGNSTVKVTDFRSGSYVAPVPTVAAAGPAVVPFVNRAN